MIINFTRSIILLSFIGFAINSDAQITITKSDMPKSGDTIRYSIVTPAAGMDFTSTGANHTWDFTDLEMSAQDLYSYKNFTSTPYLLYSQFFGAIGLKTADTINLGITKMTQLYTFYKVSSSKWTAEGTAFTIQGLPLASDYSDPDIIYNFPLSYNQKDSDTYKVSTSIPSLGSYIQKGTRHNVVDGWGKISTPYASDVSCLRIKSINDEMDSLKTTAFSFGFPVKTVTYKWLSNTEKIPMLEVSGTEVGGNFVPATIRYRDKYQAGSEPPDYRPVVDFTVNKTSGTASVDTFKFTNLTTPSAGSSYTWSFTPSAGVSFVHSTSAASTNPEVVFANAGTYSVTLSASNFAGSRDSTSVNMISIAGKASVDQLYSHAAVSIYPNPVSGSIHFAGCIKANNPVVYSITDLRGQTVLKGTHYMDTIDVSSLPPGTYFLKQGGGNTVFIKQ